jgi:hypothetical protein
MRPTAAPLREGLLQIARAFFSMISGPEALAGHRILCAPAGRRDPDARRCVGTPARSASTDAVAGRAPGTTRNPGELEIDDVQRAHRSSCCLAKGRAACPRMVLRLRPRSARRIWWKAQLEGRGRCIPPLRMARDPGDLGPA